MRYVPTGARDERLDLLRGLCLAKMVFDHAWRTPLHEYLVWVGYVTAAEGFFLISGVVAGMVYGRALGRDGLRALVARCGERATVLLLANVLFVLVMAGAEILDVTGIQPMQWRWRGTPKWHHVLAFDQPYYLHVLPRYVAFVAITPFVLWLMTRGRTALALAGSVGLYAWGVTQQGRLTLPYLEPGVTHLPVASWQLLYVVGLALGVHREKLAPAARAAARPAALAAALLVVLAGVWVQRSALAGESPLGGLHDLLVGRRWLGPLRLVDCAAWFVLAWWLVDRAWTPIRAALGWLLLPFGRHSLYVFLMHVPIVWIVKPLVDRALDAGPKPSWTGVPLDTLVLLSLLVMIRTRFLFKHVPS